MTTKAAAKFTDIHQFLDLLQGVEPTGADAWKAVCPAHADRDPSLAIRLRDGNVIVLHCFGGCATPDIVKVLGLKMSQLWLDDGSKPTRSRPRKGDGPRKQVAEYIYTDEQGTRLYKKVRYEPKDFDQFRAEGKAGWVGGKDCLKGVRRVLWALPQVIAADTVYWCEGEKDAINMATKLGVVATTCVEGAPMKASMWKDSYRKAVEGKHVTLVADNDAAGMRHAPFIAGKLDGAAASVKMLTMPKGYKDISDWLAVHGPDDWPGLLATARDYTPELATELTAIYGEPVQAEKWQNTDGRLPQVLATGRHMREVTTEALAKLHESNEPARIFRRSDGLTRVCVDEQGRPYTEAMKEAAFRGELDRACNFVRLGREGDPVPIPPPLEVVRDGMTRPSDWRFPPLLGVIESPALRADGTILSTPGYDPATRLYYYPAPGLDVPPIPDRPTDSQLQDASELVIEALADFPFDSKASWCNAIGTVLAPIVRPMVAGPVPMALFDKPQAGTGASLLAEVISTIATGRPAAMMTMPADDEAWKKAITSILVQGQLVCVVDNVEGDLWAPSLAALLTLLTWRDRILGESKIVELPHRSVWIATGNNIHLKGDLPRRCIWCRMDAHVAQPWLRDIQRFRHPDLRGWVLEARGSILAAILTVAREWTRAGMRVPDGIPILGGYESYCRVVSGVLAFMGARDFMGNLSDLYDEADRETPQWTGFLEAWHDVLGEKGYTAAELIGYINDNETLRGALPDALGYLMEKRPGEVKNYGVRLGQKLANYNGRRYPSDLVLQKAGTKKRAVEWQVVKLEPATTSPCFTLESEVGEVCTTLTCGQQNEVDKNNTYKGKVGETSPSSPLATKMGEVVSEVLGDISDLTRDPDFQFMCGNCKGKRYWLRGGTTKLCATCRPPVDGARVIDSV